MLAELDRIRTEPVTAAELKAARDFLEVVKRNTGRLHRLVEDLLFVSQVQAGREALDLAPVDIGALVGETDILIVEGNELAATSMRKNSECTPMLTLVRIDLPSGAQTA